MIGKDHKVFNNSSKCQISEKSYEEGEMALKDHDHITGKYRRIGHQECNLNLSQKVKNPCCVL